MKPAISTGLSQRNRVPLVSWTLLLSVILAIVIAWATSGRETFVVRRNTAHDFVALFGEAWSGTTGTFHVAGGRMDGSTVRVSFVSPGCDATMTLVHRRAVGSVDPSALVIQQPDNDIVAVLEGEGDCAGGSLEQLRPVAQRALAARPAFLWVAARGLVAGRERIQAIWICVALYLSIAALAVAALWRRPPASSGLLFEGLAVGGIVVLAAVICGEATIANWYSNNLPADRSILSGDDQNGVAGFFLQALAAQLLRWNERALFNLNLVVHALAGSVYYLVLRGLAVPRLPAVFSIGLWVVLPLSLRLGWSDAHHVYVELLFGVMLWAWLRAQRSEAWHERMMVPLLAMLLPFVRLEAIVLAPLPLLFGFLVGDRPWLRRCLDAAIYLVLVVVAAVAVQELFVRRYEIPLPDADLRLRELTQARTYIDLLRQFIHVESGMANWMPTVVTALIAIGVAALALQRFTLLAVLMIAIAVPQLLLGRHINAEGTVGARYFLPLLMFLALIGGYGLSAITTAVRRGLAYVGLAGARWAPMAVGASAALAILVESAPLYHFHYSFQDELVFLRTALARLPPDARILHLPVREDDQIHADPDCCLDPPRSPVALNVPAMAFEAIPIRGEHSHLPAVSDGRSYYYQGALCHLAPTAHSEGRNPGLSAQVKAMCATLASDPRLELVASAEGSSAGFWQFLHPGPVPLRLYRIR